MRTQLAIILSILVFSLHAQAGNEATTQEKVTVALARADSLLQKRMLPEAETILGDIKSEVEMEALPKDEALYYFILAGELQMFKRNMDSARQVYLQGSEFITRNTSDVRRARILRNLGRSNYFLSDFDATRSYYNQALAIYQKIQDTTQIGNAYLFLATTYNIQGNSPRALDLYQKAEEIISLQDDKQRLAMVLNNIGLVYYLQSDTVEALDYHKRSLALALEIQDSSAIARSYIAIGATLSKHDPTGALSYFLKAVRIRKAVNDERGLAQLYTNIAGAYLDMGQYQQTLNYSRLTEQFFKKNPSPNSLHYVFVNKGEAFLKLGLIDSARHYLSKAAKGATETGNQAVLQQASFSLYELERIKGNYQKALSHFELYQQVYDSTQNDEVTKKMTQIKLQYEFDQEKKEIQAEQERTALAFEQQLAEGRMWRMGMIIFILLVSTVAFFAFRAYKIKQILSERLKAKNKDINALRITEKKLSEEAIAAKERELAALAMAAHEKNTLLKEIEQKIGSLNKKSTQAETTDFKELQKVISSSYSLDNSWDSFIHQFENIHPHFFDKLKRENKSLTIDDLKLSAYLKIGMSNKEIANVTHLALSSVKSRINRLKKKLGMMPEEDLRGFMLRYA